MSLDAALRDTAGTASVQGVTGLVSLRRNLFPDAPAPDVPAFWSPPE